MFLARSIDRVVWEHVPKTDNQCVNWVAKNANAMQGLSPTYEVSRLHPLFLVC